MMPGEPPIASPAKRRSPRNSGPRRQTIDDSFVTLTSTLSPASREAARDLPFHLGLVPSPGGAFEDFVVMDPNRDLPRYGAEDPCRPGTGRLPPDTLNRYRTAHHAAAVFGLVADRVADGQVESAARWAPLLEELEAFWRSTLCDATQNTHCTDRVITEALDDLERGNRAEQAALSRAAIEGEGCLSAVDYVSFSVAKLRWFGAAAHAMLVCLDEPLRAAALRRAYDTFSIGLQCIDDALDDARDRAQRGMSFPGALGLPVGGMLAAAPLLFARAATLARAAQFHELGSWFAQLSTRTARWPVPGEPLRNALAAALLEAAVCEVIP